MTHLPKKLNLHAIASYMRHIVHLKLIDNLSQMTCLTLANLNIGPQLKNFSEIMQHQLYLTNQPNAPSFVKKLHVKGSHPTLCFETSLSDSNRLIIDNMNPHAPENRMPRLRTKFSGATILSVNVIPLKNAEHLADVIYKFLYLKHKHVLVQVSPVDKINAHVDSTSPQTSFDQMIGIVHQQHADITNTAE